MKPVAYRYEPDYTVPPGWVLEERLAYHDISHAEFARRCGRSPKLISEIIAGKATIEPITALQFERVLGVDAGIWLGIESEYRLQIERQAEAQRAERLADWAKGFPVNELVRRQAIAKPSSNADKIQKLLTFFGVASVEAWEAKQAEAQVAYRHSPSFSSDVPALATWLRLGEIRAVRIECPAYDSRAFKRALDLTRELTTTREAAAFARAQELCKESGVVVGVVKPLSGTAVSGVARWLTPRKALIQLSARYMSDDQLWFSLFHEAAHILLHSKKEIFVDYHNAESNDIDDEADRWATDFLVSQRDWRDFVESARFAREDVMRFAEDQRIASSLVVGRLHHEGIVPWNRLNEVKVRLKWAEDKS